MSHSLLWVVPSIDPAVVVHLDAPIDVNVSGSASASFRVGGRAVGRLR